jgi:hypothetical protein
MIHFLLLAILFFSSCSTYGLSVINKPATKGDLASTHVESPDPEQEKPREGEQLIISWSLPSSLIQEGACLRLQLLFNNHTQEEIQRPITRAIDYWVYELLNEAWLEKEGILSYRVEVLTKEGVVYKEWTHQLWVRWIPLDEEGS